MAKITKRLKEIGNLVDKLKKYTLDEGLTIVKKTSTAKFDESIDIAVNLGIDTRKSDQAIRGAVELPHGTGKDPKIAVFTQGKNVELAKEAGAHVVGLEDLAADVKSGNFDFDIVIASPDAMKIVGQLGTILGPKGLMPNPKVGTVAANVAEAVKKSKNGIQFRADKSGIIHATIGKASFSESSLKENFNTVMEALNKAKPASVKGTYIKKITLSSTMGIGVPVDLTI